MPNDHVMRYATFLVLLLTLVAHLPAQPYPENPQRFPERPVPREFIVDLADLIDANDEAAIRAQCDKLLTDKRVPIIVVTIPALADYDADDVEVYTRQLFDHWGVGFPNFNFGILLLVARSDRRARIEAGPDWTGTADDTWEEVMRSLMASFRKGRYSEGLVTAVDELNDFARGDRSSKPSESTGLWATLGGILAGVIAVVVRLVGGSRRRRRGGWRVPPVRRPGGGSAFSARNRFTRGAIHGDPSSGLGGYSGGGFGGGFGGGGGATGGW